ncbi:MAG: serine hydrolase, partial [Candidatus Poribacteria bacterium]|nr:serine hydrolase [Candidatus Poribacteria bacterium]
MFRYIRKLYPLTVCCSIALLLPIFSAPAAKYWSVPSKLRATIDSPLEATFELFIKNRRSRRILATTDRTSFVVYDISKNKKIVSINEDRQMMAASLIKNFVMLAYFHEVKHGRRAHTDINRGHL